MSFGMRTIDITRISHEINPGERVMSDFTPTRPGNYFEKFS